RLAIFIIGLLIFSLGISLAIKVDYLGLHPWDVLNVGFYDIFGLTIGSWRIIIGVILIIVAIILDHTYIKLGTFLNLFLFGMLVDFYLWSDLLPFLSSLFLVIFILFIGFLLIILY